MVVQEEYYGRKRLGGKVRVIPGWSRWFPVGGGREAGIGVGGIPGVAGSEASWELF